MMQTQLQSCVNVQLWGAETHWNQSNVSAFLRCTGARDGKTLLTAKIVLKNQAVICLCWCWRTCWVYLRWVLHVNTSQPFLDHSLLSGKSFSDLPQVWTMYAFDFIPPLLGEHMASLIRSCLKAFSASILHSKYRFSINSDTDPPLILHLGGRRRELWQHSAVPKPELVYPPACELMLSLLPHRRSPKSRCKDQSVRKTRILQGNLCKESRVELTYGPPCQ